MAIDIVLQNDPNQNFQLLQEEDTYDITLRSIDEETYVTITRNSVLLISNFKAMPNQDIIPFEYLFFGFGNFRFNSEDSTDYPFFTAFGISTFFQYITKEEVESGL